MYQRQLMALVLPLVLACQASAQRADDDFDTAREKALRAAVLKVAPSVVQIQTAGGIDIVDIGGGGPMGGGATIRKGVGPTTGLVVAADGFIISSAFNFINKPTEIFVSVPGHKDRYTAKVIANDTTRMLTLLKIEATNLPAPVAAPKKDIKVGQWAVAVGRTWGSVETPPSMSIGIISALDRIWGKAVQTDAKVSPVNYGGPLVDVLGRVQGVLVPASPQGQDETAGHEWYDSGIGFAIPLEDVLAVLPRLKEGKNLSRGFLGVTPQSGDIYSAAPVIGTVAPESAAARAGMKPGDTIVEIDGVKVARQAQVMHVLGKKYDGDTVAVKIRRGAEEISYKDLKLTGNLSAVTHAFLGILPMRDDPELGVEVRYVFPKSPADAAGLKEGDRIMGIGKGTEAPKPFAGREGLQAALNVLPVGSEIVLDVRRKAGKANEKLKVKLEAMPDSVPDKLPANSTLKKALEPKKTVGPAPMPPEGQPEPKKEDPKKVETGMIKRSNAARDHEYWIYVPENYDPNVSHALVIWLHPVGKGRERDAEAMVSMWEDFCADQHMILLGPRATNETGWLVSEADFVREAIRDVANQYTIDRQRVVAHGMGVGGQLSYYLGFNARDIIRGVATVGAVIPGEAKDNAANQRLAFFVVAGAKDPRLKAIQDNKTKLVEKKFPVVFRELAERGHEYLETSADTLKELVRWIDSLDRL